MATVEELNAYYDRLKETFESGIASSDYNDDRAHNAMVMKLMFDTANTINMYCGELSILRSGFKNHVAKEITNGGQIIDSMFTSFDNFLKKDNSSLNIILENYKEDYFKDLVRPDTFETALEKGKIKIYGLSDDLTFKSALAHFAFSDNNIIRKEQDKSLHSAICSFNETQAYSKSTERFEALKTISAEKKPPFKCI